MTGGPGAVLALLAAASYAEGLDPLGVVGAVLVLVGLLVQGRSGRLRPIPSTSEEQP